MDMQDNMFYDVHWPDSRCLFGNFLNDIYRKYIMNEDNSII